MFIWEAVDVIFLGLINNIHTQQKFKQMVNAKITFAGPVTSKPVQTKETKNITTKEEVKTKQANKS